MADERVSVEKSYRDWLAEALAQDEKTWNVLEEKLRTIRLKQRDLDRPAARPKEPRDC